MCVLPECTTVGVTGAHRSQMKTLDPPSTEVVGGCELPYRC